MPKDRHTILRIATGTTHLLINIVAIFQSWIISDRPPEDVFWKTFSIFVTHISSGWQKHMLQKKTIFQLPIAQCCLRATTFNHKRKKPLVWFLFESLRKQESLVVCCIVSSQFEQHNHSWTRTLQLARIRQVSIEDPNNNRMSEVQLVFLLARFRPN